MSWLFKEVWVDELTYSCFSKNVPKQRPKMGRQKFQKKVKWARVNELNGSELMIWNG